MKKIKFKNTVNLAETKFGSKIIYKTDEFFGAAKRILSAEKPIFKDHICIRQLGHVLFEIRLPTTDHKPPTTDY